MHSLPERALTRNALAHCAPLMARHGLGARVLLVADAATWNAAGSATEHHAATAAETTRFVFAESPAASIANAQRIMHAAQAMSGLIAIGSGTLNDLTKYAAAQLNLPYLVVATAASMNGYTSATASLEENGFKHSHTARPPRAVIADSDIIAAAPPRLARAGFGDTLCRSTVEADMLLSHFLRGTTYPRALFDRLRANEQALVSAVDGLAAHTPEAMALLMHALLDGGDAMTEFGSSAVASQGEHMLAHTLELLAPAPAHALYHGELIAITTLTMAQLQEQFLQHPPHIRALPRTPAHFTVFGADAATLHANYQQKQLAAPEAMQHRVQEEWKTISATIAAILRPSAQLAQLFARIGLATEATEAGFSAETYATARAHAYLTRERFTFLDIAEMSAH